MTTPPPTPPPSPTSPPAAPVPAGFPSASPVLTAGPAVTRAPVTFDDLTAGLLWPKIFKAAWLALSPSRIGLAVALVVILATLNEAGKLIPDSPATGPIAALAAWFLGGLSILWSTIAAIVWLPVQTLIGAGGWAPVITGGRSGAFLSWGLMGAEGLPTASLSWVINEPGRLLLDHPISTLAALLPAGLITAIFATAIARSAAAEFSMDVRVPWTRALAFGIARVRATAFATFLPFLLLLTLLGGSLAVGTLLTNTLGWSWAAYILVPVCVVVGTIAALALLAYVLGQGLLVPAVAADGADAMDAIQRAYAYVIGRPIRLLLYGSLLGLQTSVLATLVAVVLSTGMNLASRSTAIADATTNIASRSAAPPEGWGERGWGRLPDPPFDPDGGFWSNEPLRGAGVFELAATTVIAPWNLNPPGWRFFTPYGPMADLPPSPRPDPKPSLWSQSPRAAAIAFTSDLIRGLALAIGISLSLCGWTIIYLLLRQLVDGQDIGELWLEPDRELIGAAGRPDATGRASAPQAAGGA